MKGSQRRSANDPEDAPYLMDRGGAVRLAKEIWVVHAFWKRSTQGIKTPQRELDLIKDRLKRLKEMLQ